MFYITLSRGFIYSTEKKQQQLEADRGFHYCQSVTNRKSLEIKLVPGGKVTKAYVATYFCMYSLERHKRLKEINGLF